MTLPERDSTTKDSDLEAQGADNSGEGNTPISLDDKTIDALLSHPSVEARISQIAESKTQKVKDRRIAKLENQVGDILGQIDLSPEQQAKVKEIERDNLLRQLSEKVLGGESPAVPEGGQASPQTGKPVDVVGSFEAVGFNPSSITAEDYAFASQFQDEASLKNALLKKRLELEQAEQENTVDGAIMPQGGANPPRDALAKLRANYEAELKLIRPGNADAIANLKVKYRRQGLDIN